MTHPPNTGEGLRWYRAFNERATFAFAIEGDRVVRCAPHGRRWLHRRDKPQARAALRQRRFRVVELSTSEQDFLAEVAQLEREGVLSQVPAEK